MKKSNKQAGEEQISRLEYMVISVTELDQMVYATLKEQSAAKPSDSYPSQYVITDKEKAKSQNVLPRIFNPLGKKGWNLVGVNKMECYIFERDEKKTANEYLVCTPPELDRKALNILEGEGHLKLSGFEGETPTVEVTSPENAKIQEVLPKVLSEYASDGWQLCAINGPQLYFFTRKI